MLLINRTRKFRISNRIAGMAALLLVVTSLAGVGGSTLSDVNGSALFASSMVTEEAPSLLQSDTASKVRKNRGFKMSLFLFRNK